MDGRKCPLDVEEERPVALDFLNDNMGARYVRLPPTIAQYMEASSRVKAASSSRAGGGGKKRRASAPANASGRYAKTKAATLADAAAAELPLESSHSRDRDPVDTLIETFVTPNKDKGWMYFERLETIADGTRKVDPRWVQGSTNSPCFEKEEDANDKRIIKFKSKLNDCGETPAGTHGNTRSFTINNAHVLIAKKSDEHADFFEQARHVCAVSFGYHCGRSDGSGIGAGYFETAWTHATHIAMCICRDGSGGFVVLGFALLRDYSHKGISCFTPYKTIPGQMIMSGRPRIPKNVLYIDIVCSQLSLAHPLLQMLCNPGKWRSIVFKNPAAVHEPHYVLLRAIPTVYTYYPVMFGFVRSLDNETIAPIFRIPENVFRQALAGTSYKDLSLENIATSMCGPKDDVVTGPSWEISKRRTLSIYRLPRTFTAWVKSTGLTGLDLTRFVEKVFLPTQLVYGDSNSNGYLYGLYVPSAVVAGGGRRRRLASMAM